MEAWAKEAVSLLENLDPEHPSLIYSLDIIAHLDQLQGRYSEAENLFKRVLDICERSCGSDNPLYASSLGSLATFYAATSRPTEALPLVERASRIRDRSIGQSLASATEEHVCNIVRQSGVESMTY